jgi:NRAMP (natural resistance-associated macrophage protein)-like metal ion transporter
MRETMAMSRRKRFNRKNLIIFLSVLGPGIIVSMVDNDAGGIATYSVAGAKYGYGIIWVMIPSLLLLYMIQEMNARMGIVTGKGLASLIRERFSLRLTAMIMVAMIVANFANAVSNFAGIAASSELFGISRYLAVPLAAFLVWFMLLKGTYRVVEKIFLLVGGIYVCYIISAFLAKPYWGAVAKGTFIPSGHIDTAYIIMVITIIGTTIAPWMQFYQQASVVDKGLEVKDLTFEKWDTAIGNGFLFIAAVAIIVCCAAAFYNNPNAGAVQITSADQAALALAPIAGKNASYLFGAGLLFASLFAASILPLSTAYTLCEAFGWEVGIDRKFGEARNFYLIYTAFIVGGAVLVLIPRIPLITVMLTSQAVNGLLLPVIVTCMLLIVQDRDIMGNYVNGDTYNKVAWFGVLILYVLDAWLVIATVFGIGS